MSDRRIVVWLIVSFGCVSLWSASKSIPHGAAFGLLILNCLRGGIGGGIVSYNVYWNIGPNCPFAFIW